MKRPELSERNKTHGLSLDENGRKTRLYGLWGRMKQRCRDPRAKDYPRYGGRGISICQEWRDFKNFHDWALSNGYNDSLTIERSDCNGNYEPSNCSWITPAAQARNTRKNHRITYMGQTKTLAEWSEILGMESSLIRYRLKAWGNIDEALSTPVGRTNYETIKARTKKF